MVPKKHKSKDFIGGTIAKAISKISIPFSIFRHTKLTVQESLVFYLKEEKNLKFREIAKLLKRDERNVWTLYNRAKKKMEER